MLYRVFLPGVRVSPCETVVGSSPSMIQFFLSEKGSKALEFPALSVARGFHGDNVTKSVGRNAEKLLFPPQIK